MKQIRSEDTKPELRVRQIIFGLGYRYRLHARDLPGRPDLAFRSRKKALFIHGCFWHQHPNRHCKDAHLPQTRLSYWRPKLTRNVERDQRNIRLLNDLGWDVHTIWACEIADEKALEWRLRRFLG